jgi:hypothetical protein
MVGAVVIEFVAYIAFAGFLFFNTLYLQDVRRFSPLHAGIWTVPTTAAVLVAAPISGQVLGGRGARLPATAGMKFFWTVECKSRFSESVNLRSSVRPIT